MPKRSTTVPIKHIPTKRHRVPDYYRGKSQKKHDWKSPYGNGANGELRKPAQPKSQ